MTDELVPGLQYASRAQELWASVVATYPVWEERLNRAAQQADLSPVSVWALVQLDPDDPISQKELAARLKCNPSTVVDPTDRLEDAGLVERRPDPADRRVNILVITARGKSLREKLIAELFEPPEPLMRLSATELAHLRAAMLDTAAGPAQAPGARRTTRQA